MNIIIALAIVLLAWVVFKSLWAVILVAFAVGVVLWALNQRKKGI